MHIEQMSAAEVDALLPRVQADYDALAARALALDLTRGKPCAEQVALSDALDGILQGDFHAADGSDVRNYGGLRGLPEARALFAQVLEVPAEELLVGGNSSLQLMYATMEMALSAGLRGPQSAWGNEDEVTFICPVPGYDRHFSVCEHLGIAMLTVPMLDDGPDMDAVESLVRADHTIRGLWCVPRFSNPTGCVYSDETVRRIAQLGNIAADHFLVLWDNAYAVHALSDTAPPLAPIRNYCAQYGTLDTVVQFGSTSKVTFAGAGVAFLSSSSANLRALEQYLGYQTIGPDKVNQLRHVKLLQDRAGIEAHMRRHAQIIQPRFNCVLETLESELAGTGMGQWQVPQGGYFISFNCLPGLARIIVQLAADVGVKLTPAGATYPYGNDPLDNNIRLAPTFPSLNEVQESVDAFVLCVKLASLRQRVQSG